MLVPFHCLGPCLYESGLVPEKLSFREDAEVLKYGIGMSNIVPRTTRSAKALSRSGSPHTTSFSTRIHSALYHW